MGNMMSFLGGIVALAVLGFLLFFELSRESMVFAYVISALIVLVLAVMFASIRGALIRIPGGLAGRLRRQGPGKGPEIPKNRPDKPVLSEPQGLPRRVSNPVLNKIMQRIRKGKLEGLEDKPAEKGGKKPKKQSRFPGLLGRIGNKLRIGRGASGRAMTPAKQEAEMDSIENETEGQEMENIETVLEKETEGKRPAKGRSQGKRGPKEKSTKGEESLAKLAGSCQICGGREGLGVHYIVPLDKGGGEEEGNTIMLCKKHREQAEGGIYSENLLRKLKSA